MNRFVLLRHQTAENEYHWDFLFERETACLTFSMTGELPFEKAKARRLPDHRLAYLEYEGPVSGNRGSVLRVDSGEYVELGNTISFQGTRFHGTVENLSENCVTIRLTAVHSKSSDGYSPSR